jgi:hypothetical protein
MLFYCLRFARTYKSAASYGSLRGVMVFAKERQKPRRRSVPTYAVPRLRASGSRSVTLAPLAARLAKACPLSANRSVPPLFAATVQPFGRRRFSPRNPIADNHKQQVYKKKELKTSRQKPKKQSKGKSAYRVVKFKPFGFY